MGFADHYLAKHGSGKHFIAIPPGKKLKYSIVIPAFNEPDLISCLDSLWHCMPVSSSVEVITAINWPFLSDDPTIMRNLEIMKEAESWAERHASENIRFHFMLAEPGSKKDSGVGFARKTGMDEAIRRLNDLNKEDSILISLDADTLVEENYFLAIEEHLKKHPDTHGFNLYFEHPLEGNFPAEVYEAVAAYELHLRYYLQALRYAGHPNAFHTVGSAFAIKAPVYCQQGGMNRRQAGEDFYFLQKIFDLGNFSECKSTRVIPSARPSSRVPFGTGPIVIKYQENKKEQLTNHPALFEILKDFFQEITSLYNLSCEDLQLFTNNLHPLLQSFLNEKRFLEKIREIRSNSSTPHAFRKRFFRWFNMFMALKFLNSGKKDYPDIPVSFAAKHLLEKKGRKGSIPYDVKDILAVFRNLEKG